MFTFFGSKRSRFCDGVSRREFLCAGTLTVGGLSLADIFRARAAGASRQPSSLKSIIMVYLHGGPSQLDMFDMKPQAPAEFRGEFQPIRTNVPGLDICELMPRLATIADQYAVIRNLSFMDYLDGHNPPLVYTGYPTSIAKPSHRPTFGSVVSRLRGDLVRDMPPYVAFDGIDTNPVRGPDYLGISHRPFVPGTRLGSLGPLAGMTLERLNERASLMHCFDAVRRDLDDRVGAAAGMDALTQRALEMITTTKARDAFDISREPDRIRDLYGPGGTQFLQARRLVEAGVQVVTLTANAENHTWDRAGPWDNHGRIFPALRKLLPALDHNLFGLLTDLSQRGLDRDCAVVVWGEMGRTPRVNKGAGRDHWNDVGFALVAGGGLKTGQVIGATTSRAERATGHPYTPQHMLASLYENVLGIDLAHTQFNYNGRPMYLLDHRDKIAELI